MSDKALLAPELLAALEELRKDPGQSAIVFDFDGTLIPISPAPQEIDVPPVLIEHLRKINNKYALVVIASGRPVIHVAEMIGLKDLIYIGNHGWESITNGRKQDITDEAIEKWHKQVVEKVLKSASLFEVPGVIIEEKYPGVAVHYREVATENWDDIKRIVQALAKETQANVQPGKKVLELRHASGPTKADSIRPLLDKHGVRNVLYAGDDYTDAISFMAMSKWDKKIRVFRIGIYSEEMPAELKESADFMLSGQGQVEQVLESLI